MPSFDVVSESDPHEVQNAFDQADRELKQRYDFRGTQAEIKKTDTGFEISANGEDRVKAAYEVLVEKFIKRKISLKFLDKKDVAKASGQTFRMVVGLKKGIDKENAKAIVQFIKDQKSLKVTPAIQGDSLRVTGKKKDDLQETIQFLRSKDLPIEITFINFRD